MLRKAGRGETERCETGECVIVAEGGRGSGGTGEAQLPGDEKPFVMPPPVANWLGRCCPKAPPWLNMRPFPRSKSESRRLASGRGEEPGRTDSND